LKAYIIAIGDELLTGRTLDYNSHWIAKRLTGLGIEVKKIIIIPDNKDEIIEAIRTALNKDINIIVTTGGLGPTPGDITLEAISMALNIELKLDNRALKMIKDRYEDLFKLGYVASKEITESRKKMALIPEGSIPFFNPIGVAPGILLQISEDKLIISLPGVPSEMMYLLEQILKYISLKSEDTFIKTREMTVEVRDESLFAEILTEMREKFPNINIKSYPVGFGKKVFMRVIAVAKGNAPEKLDDLIEKSFEYLKQKLHESKVNL